MNCFVTKTLRFPGRWRENVFRGSPGCHGKLSGYQARVSHPSGRGCVCAEFSFCRRSRHEGQRVVFGSRDLILEE